MKLHIEGKEVIAKTGQSLRQILAEMGLDSESLTTRPIAAKIAGELHAEALISMTDRPTAIFATNHNITIGLVTAARDQGLQIPQDLDVFGFDSVEVCAMMRPPLPVVEQPEQEIGRLAATYLIDRFSGYTGEARITRLPCTVSEIESR